MGLLSNPKVSLFARIAQLAFALAVLICLAYANTHKGAWKILTGPVALGVVAVIFTLCVTLYGFWVHFKKSGAVYGKLVTIVRVVLEFIIFLMWVGTATLMLRPKDREPERWFQSTPDISWYLGVAFSFVEIVLFALSTAVVALEMRGGRSGGISASYV